MSEVVENVSEQNSAQNEVTAPSTETVEDVTPNNVDAAVKAVPEAVEIVSAASDENVDSSVTKGSPEKSTSPKVDNKKTPVKRTPSKRMSFIERAQKESEELVKNMGGSLEIEGGRKTRSSTRGTPSRSAAVPTPPPAKKARASPASGASTPTRPRGRGRKIDTGDDENEEVENKPTPSKKKTPTKDKQTAAKKEEEEEVVEENAKEEEDVKEAKVAETVEEENKEKPDLIESNVAAEEIKETPASSEQTKEEDVIDAVLEPVVEETESQIESAVLETIEKNVTNEPENKNDTADVILEISESVKSDSPMDTDVEIVEEKIKDKQVVEKPTPEPMEIDSSSNSNDVVEIHTESSVVTEPTKTSESEQSTTAHNNIEKVEETSIESPVVPSVDIVANNASEKPAEVIDIADVNANANDDTNKTENDLCEPKIATTSPISASNENSSTTTQQSCN